MRFMRGVMKGAIAASKTVLWCAVFTCALVAGAATAGDDTRGAFAVWAIGLPDGYVVMERQGRVIQVSAEHAAQDAVRMRREPRFVLVTHAPAEYAVDFHVSSALMRAVGIEGIGEAVRLGTAGGTAAQPQATLGRRDIVVDYRFVLPPDAIPGVYAWPLQMDVRRLAPTDPERAGGVRRLLTISARAEL